MNSAHWEKIQKLFHDAADLPVAEQQAFLNTACEGDSTLIADVMTLLTEDSRGDSLLDQSVTQVAHVAVDPGPEFLISQELGPYKVKKVLGEGGMGVVYLAEREDLQSLVAIKILRDAWLSPARRDRFATEQRTLAELNHPSIARLYDADTLADGTPCFVMEYVEGIPLTDYCNQYQCSIRTPYSVVSRGLRSGAVCAPTRSDPSRFEAFKYSCERRLQHPIAGLRNRQTNRQP